MFWGHGTGVIADVTVAEEFQTDPGGDSSGALAERLQLARPQQLRATVAFRVRIVDIHIHIHPKGAEERE